MAYEPSISINNSPESDEAFKRHFDEQIKLYGKVVVINLLKVKGKENQLHLEFDKKMKALVEKSSSVAYIFFDLHHHCGTTRFDKLSILLDEINSHHHLESVAFFQSKKDKVIQEQKGIFRTNCKDCLDRTNLAQG